MGRSAWPYCTSAIGLSDLADNLPKDAREFFASGKHSPAAQFYASQAERAAKPNENPVWAFWTQYGIGCPRQISDSDFSDFLSFARGRHRCEESAHFPKREVDRRRFSGIASELEFQVTKPEKKTVIGDRKMNPLIILVPQRQSFHRCSKNSKERSKRGFHA